MHSDHITNQEMEEYMFIKKNTILIILFVVIITVSINAKEMNLWGNHNGAEEFATLTLEEQYTSYINSFKDIRDVREQPMKWAKRMVSKYGRDVIPLMNETISNLTFDHVYRKPYDSTETCVWYLIIALEDNKLFSDIEKELYTLIFEAKIDNYVLKYKIIDGTVKAAYSFFAVLNGLDTRKETAETWRDYYQERLGIDDIVAGDINQLWH